MKLANPKATAIIIALPLLFITVLGIFGADTKNIPEMCKKYIVECDCGDYIKKLINNPTPENIDDIADLIDQVAKLKDNPNLPKELKEKITNI
jgi:hypothetical protein